MIQRALLRFYFSYQPMIKFPSRSESQPIQQIKFSGKKIKLTPREALNQALDQQIARDSQVYLIGEEVAQYNGAYKISKGLLDKFGSERIIDTPITQAGFTGMAIGSSLLGLKPVVQFMTMNFALQAIDHIMNSSAKLNYMSAGQLGGSIVFRGLNGPAAAVAAQHSQCFASIYANIPGLITISPYDAQDCKGLLKAAIRDPNPVIFLENQNLYGQHFETPQQVSSSSFIIPIGKAKIMRQGTDVTIVGYSRNVKYSMEAAQQLQKQGISCEVINLRTIKPLDRDTIIKSVIKTGRLISVEDDFPQHGVGSQIVSIVYETKAFDYLKAPPERVTAIDVPMPYAKLIEEEVVPRVQSVKKAINKVMNYE